MDNVDGHGADAMDAVRASTFQHTLYSDLLAHLLRESHPGRWPEDSPDGDGYGKKDSAM